MSVVKAWNDKLLGAVASILADLDTQTLRRLAIAVVAVQILGVAAACLTRLMLYADGAYFVFALNVGDPWSIKWSEIPARATVYVLTVPVTQFIASSFQLKPLATADINGLFYYAIPLILNCIALRMAWQRGPRYLAFPIAQYVFASSLIFGFPSEITLAPGFLWICAFLLIGHRRLGALFAISFAGLIFTHELAIPSAVVLLFMLVRRGLRSSSPEERLSNVVTLGLSLAVTAAYLVVFLRDSEDRPFLHILNPVTLFYNPTVLLIGATAIGFGAYARLGSPPERVLGAWRLVRIMTAFALGMIVLHVAAPDLNFAQGRYQSARTITGFAMFGLILLFALLTGRSRADAAPGSWRGTPLLPAFAAASLAVSATSAALFLADWHVALAGERSVVAGRAQGGGNLLIAYDDASRIMSADEARAADRMDFRWSTPFRSAILADGHTPARIIHDVADLGFYCRRSNHVAAGSLIPAATVDAIGRFACSHHGPPDPVNFRDRALAAVRRWIGASP